MSRLGSPFNPSAEGFVAMTIVIGSPPSPTTFESVLADLSLSVPDDEYAAAMRYVQWLMRASCTNGGYQSVAMTLLPNPTVTVPPKLIEPLQRLIKMFEVGRGLYPLAQRLILARCDLRFGSLYDFGYVDGLYMPLPGAWTVWFAREEDGANHQIVPHPFPPWVRVCDDTVRFWRR